MYLFRYLILSNTFLAAVLRSLHGYARKFSCNVGHVFTDRTIRVSALTGAAATEVGGETTSREYDLNSKKDTATLEDIIAFQETRLNIIDEISFADYDKVLAKISARLQTYTECHEFTFGKIPIVFLGDFRQLESVGGNAIYKHPNGLYWEQALNCMVELKTPHRFRNCKVLKKLMPELHTEGLSEENRKILNSRVIDGKNIVMPAIAKTRFATYHNRNRAEINARIFEQYLESQHADATEENIPTSAIVIKSSPKWARCKKKLNYSQRKVFFEQCSEADTNNYNKKRFCPLLCLFSGCMLMGTENKEVKNGIANGTQSTFEKVKIKPGKVPHPIKMHGKWVYAIDIEDVEYLQLRWYDSATFEGTFKVFPDEKTFRVKYPIEDFGIKTRVNASFEVTHFPVVVNHATTGHKLQGKSLDELVIAEWSTVQNWAYVVLSRVRTIEGLYLTKPIPRDIDFAPPQLYLEMMERLRSSILATSSDMEQYRATVTI